jgi:hypothetical protein
MSQGSSRAWLLLLPQAPPQPSSLRVRVWRRLGQIGAVAVKNAAYALPENETTLEDFTWLRQEILDAGGGALLLRAQGLGTADREIEQLFRDERDQDYRKLAEEAAAFAEIWRREKDLQPDDFLGAERSLRQFSERLAAIRALDFFQADGAAAAGDALLAAASAVETRKEPYPVPDPPTYRMPRPCAQLWVTRAGVYVDRCACAWMIRRFVDPEARFSFVASGEPLPEGGVPFDMPGADLGHQGARCSAEVIVGRYVPDDGALRAVAEVVHDLDLKDEGFGRAEAPGLKCLLDGICALTRDDGERVRASGPLFDALYAGFR